VIIRFVNVGGIVDHHCLNFLNSLYLLMMFQKSQKQLT